MFGLFKRKDPVCGMKEEKGRGKEKNGKWFCSDDCAEKYGEMLKKNEDGHAKHGRGCCH